MHGVRLVTSPAPNSVTRARGGGGSPLATPCLVGVSSLASSPYVPAVSLPSLPIHSCPPPLSNGHANSSATSAGRGGYRLPSRHTTFTSGRLPFAAKL